MDSQLVEKIVHEVKSQGVFDEFRKDSMADVDTKPAYQNLRQRVENTVKKFLSEQKWTPDTNKNQLREKLRRHISESGFLDVGVERIVDQVVNPKVGSVFQPRIEEIAYNYLGLAPPPKKYEPPPPPLMHPLPPLPLNGPNLKVETCSLLPTDLEQVSPDSDKATVDSVGGDDRTAIDMDTDDKIIDDEDESPPFEPLVKEEIKDEMEDMKLANKEDNVKIKEELESSLDSKKIIIEESNDASIKAENLMTDTDSQELSNFVPGTIDKEASQSMDGRISQDSQLSSVSSDSRLSVNCKEDSLQSSSQEAVAANISEEAQMPKFNENSSEPNAINSSGDNKSDTKISELHFDIKKDEIKFEGTERKTGLETPESSSIKTEAIKYSDSQEIPSDDNKTEAFKFSSNNSNLEAKENLERTPNAQESSFGSSIDDDSSITANTTPKISGDNKEKEISMEEKSPLLQTPKQPIPATPTTTPIPTPPMATPTATPSPLSSQKIDKDQSSRHSSSSSSKHKKHSKERRRSYDREKDKDRHRSSTKDSSSKHHSSSASKSSKHSSSSTNRSSSSTSHNKSSNEKDLEKSSSSTHSSTKQLKHSHSSSSSNEHNDSKNSKRDSDRRHHSSSSKSHKEHSSSSKRSNEKKDDHYEAKNKIQRRKSTDSNDDDGDKSLGGGGKSSSQYKSSSSSSASKSTKSKASSEVKSPSTKTYDSQKDLSHLETDNEEKTPQCHNNIVILNDILENPQTQYIQLDNTGHQVETPQQIVTLTHSIDNKEFTEFNNNNELLPTKEEKTILNSSMELLYFEDAIQYDFKERLQILENTIDLYRTAVNYLRFDSLPVDNGIELSKDEDLNSDNKSNLLTETLKRKSDVNFEEYEKTPRKRAASNESEEGPTKTSPTPSDSSANSKENEEIDKNTDVAKKSLVDRHKAVQKLTQQQRYSSEDLYKPRPILGQRSRRRGMDSLV